MVSGSFVAGNVRSVFEGSRQIFAWLYDMGDSMTEESDNPQCALVRPVKFVEVEQDTLEYVAAPGMCHFYLAIAKFQSLIRATHQPRI